MFSKQKKNVIWGSNSTYNFDLSMWKYFVELMGYLNTVHSGPMDY